MHVRSRLVRPGDAEQRGPADRAVELALAGRDLHLLEVRACARIVYLACRLQCVLGDSRLELLEATSEDSSIAKFIAKRGEGLHHLCLRVPDLTATVEALKRDGVRLVSDEIKIGAGGHRYIFIHPASAGGVLLELVEEH